MVDFGTWGHGLGWEDHAPVSGQPEMCGQPGEYAEPSGQVRTGGRDTSTSIRTEGDGAR